MAIKLYSNVTVIAISDLKMDSWKPVLDKDEKPKIKENRPVLESSRGLAVIKDNDNNIYPVVRSIVPFELTAGQTKVFKALVVPWGSNFINYSLTLLQEVK